jgi:echinoderm microtubule-associated protein-like 6
LEYVYGYRCEDSR